MFDLLKRAAASVTAATAGYITFYAGEDGRPKVLDADSGLTYDFEGPQGPSGTADAGTTTTGAPGSNASVTADGTPQNRIFNFTIPRGDQGIQGNDGWEPILGVVSDGERRVLRLIDWTGGTGAKPTAFVGQYLGPEGYVAAIGSATDVRGAQGVQGNAGPAGQSVSVSDEGSQLTAAVTSINVVGEGITASAVGSVVTLTVPFQTAAQTGAVPVSSIGAANGVAPLGADSKISATYLPSYVDDVLEFSSLAAFPVTGETGKLYVAIDTNKPYRWSGSTYFEISPSPGSTDAVPEGSTNLYFTNARAAAAAPVQSVAGRAGVVTLNSADVGLANVANPAAAAVITSANVGFTNTPATPVTLTIPANALTGPASFEFEACGSVINTITASNFVVDVLINGAVVTTATVALGTTANASPGRGWLVQGLLTFQAVGASGSAIAHVMSAVNGIIPGQSNHTVNTAVNTTANVTLGLRISSSAASSTGTVRQAHIKAAT